MIFMKKIIIINIIILLCLSFFVGCEVAEPAKVDREIVDAVVVDTGTGRGGRWIQVAYDGVMQTWKSKDLYNYYHTRHGASIQCVLVTYTYESGRTKRELLYNEDIENRNGWKEVT